MKKMMFVLTFLCFFTLLAGQVMASYSVSGTVYYRNTTIPVSNAKVTLSSSSGLQSTVFADAFGSFSVYWGGVSEIGNSMKLAASSGAASGQTKWTASQNTENKNVYIAVMIQADPSLDIHAMPAHWVGAGSTEVISSVVLQGTGAPVQLQNVQVNMFFNPVIAVNDVAPVAPVSSFTWDIPAPGQLVVNAGFAAPHNVPDFPAESFFDVFYEVEIPETDATVIPITMDAEGIIIVGGNPADGSAIPTLTENLAGEPAECQTYFLIDEEDEWLQALNADWPQANIIPMTPAEWNDPDPDFGYMAQWTKWLEEGEPYDPIPLAEFRPPELYIYPGDGDEGAPDPDDAGLVMKWGDGESGMTEGGEYASAWKYDYGLDPDLTNCIIKVTATPPAGITNISLGLQDINGAIRSWHWTCGPGGVLPSGVPTTIRVDTSMLGLAATNPTASGFANNPNFDLTKVQNIIADENGTWVAQQASVPPGGQIPAIWNYWHNLSVQQKVASAYKGNYVKFSQPPEERDGLIYGWDVKSVFPFNFDQGMTWTWAADDWLCYDERPVTDVHWWGSFIGWQHKRLPPQVPDYFIMAIWKDVPADAATASHPKELLWTHKCYKWVWNYAGDDKDPRSNYIDPTGAPMYDFDHLGMPQENEACFQFNQLLSEDDYFYQEPMQILEDGTVIPNVYWFSIAAVYEGMNIADIEYPWGWKTKRFDPEKAPDAAVVITDLDPGTPPLDTVALPGTGGHVSEVVNWYPLLLPYPNQYPEGEWFDLAFELTTNEPKCPGLMADLNNDCIVNLPDFAIMAQEWLMTSP